MDKKVKNKAIERRRIEEYLRKTNKAPEQRLEKLRTGEGKNKRDSRKENEKGQPRFYRRS